jgi:hypothetical protein
MASEREADKPLVPATDEHIASALAYALHFDARGKARRGGGELAASLAAERLRASVFVLMRGRSARPHSTG